MHFLPKPHILFGHYPYLGTHLLPMPHLFPNGITLMCNNFIKVHNCLNEHYERNVEVGYLESHKSFCKLSS
jgi:hypothetical protein